MPPASAISGIARKASSSYRCHGDRGLRSRRPRVGRSRSLLRSQPLALQRVCLAGQANDAGARRLPDWAWRRFPLLSSAVLGSCRRCFRTYRAGTDGRRISRHARSPSLGVCLAWPAPRPTSWRAQPQNSCPRPTRPDRVNSSTRRLAGTLFRDKFAFARSVVRAMCRHPVYYQAAVGAATLLRRQLLGAGPGKCEMPRSAACSPLRPLAVRRPGPGR
jgi:hypothetical protein